MKTINLPLIAEIDEDGIYIVSCPVFKGCHAYGKTIDEAMSIDNMDIVEELALPPVKIHCSVLAEDAIKSAILDYKKKNGITTGVAVEELVK